MNGVVIDETDETEVALQVMETWSHPFWGYGASGVDAPEFKRLDGPVARARAFSPDGASATAAPMPNDAPCSPAFSRAATPLPGRGYARRGGGESPGDASGHWGPGTVSSSASAAAATGHTAGCAPTAPVRLACGIREGIAEGFVDLHRRVLPPQYAAAFITRGGAAPRPPTSSSRSRTTSGSASTSSSPAGSGSTPGEVCVLLAAILAAGHWGDGTTSATAGQRFAMPQKMLRRTYSTRFNTWRSSSTPSSPTTTPRLQPPERVHRPRTDRAARLHGSGIHGTVRRRTGDPWRCEPSSTG